MRKEGGFLSFSTGISATLGSFWRVGGGGHTFFCDSVWGEFDRCGITRCLQKYNILSMSPTISLHLDPC